MISRGGAGGYSLVAFHIRLLISLNHQLAVQINKGILEGGDHVLGGRMRVAGYLRSLLSGDGADGLGRTTVWVHWGGVDQRAYMLYPNQYFE